MVRKDEANKLYGVPCESNTKVRSIAYLAAVLQTDFAQTNVKFIMYDYSCAKAYTRFIEEKIFRIDPAINITSNAIGNEFNGLLQ